MTDKLPEFAWPGGYPLYYRDDEGDVLCAECANELMMEALQSQNKDEFVKPQLTPDVNYEDQDLFCDVCSKYIPPAYPED